MNVYRTSYVCGLWISPLSLPSTPTADSSARTHRTSIYPYIIHICGFALIQSESFLSMNGENMKKMQMQTPTTENRSANTANCNEFLHSFNSIFNIRAVYWFCIWSDVRQLLIHTRINEFANLNESRNQSGFRSKVYARIAMKLVRNDQLEN